MQSQQQGDRLSWGDTVFLHLEREGMPLNVASVCVFEGKIPFEACVQFVESKLPLIPRYLKRVVPPLLNIGLPSWEYDPTFDIRRHVREATLKHGSDEELKTFAGKVLSTVMDRQHPLWDMTLVHGLKGDRSAFIFRLHHCLADGIAGVGIMNVVMDTSAVAPRVPKRSCSGGCGSLFKLTPASNGGWTYTVVHVFGHGADGYHPTGDLILDPTGNLYGTTQAGGAQGSGMVFEIMH